MSYYGMTRKEALSLKHWEFESCRKFFYQQKARDALSNYQSVSMAFGGSKEDTKEYLNDLRERAGYNTKPKRYQIINNVTTIDAGERAKPIRALSIFDNMMGIQPLEVYEDLKVNKIEGYGDE
jgi:hypothetical protein